MCYQILFGHPRGGHLAVAGGHIKPSVTIFGVIAVDRCGNFWNSEKCVDFEIDFAKIPF